MDRLLGDAVSDEELVTERKQLRHEREQIRQELADLASDHEELREAAEEADGAESERHATRAEQKRRKYEMTAAQLERTDRELAALVLVDVLRELLAEADADPDDLDTVVRDRDLGAARDHLREQLTDHGLDRDDLREASRLLDVEVPLSELLDDDDDWLDGVSPSDRRVLDRLEFDDSGTVEGVRDGPDLETDADDPDLDDPDLDDPDLHDPAVEESDDDGS